MLRGAAAETLDPEGPSPADCPIPDTPERSLLRAMLRGAAVELRYRNRRVRADALVWLAYEGDEWGSVAHVAEVLGLDVGRLGRMAAGMARRR